MKIFVVSAWAWGLGQWLKMRDEGNSVTVHVGCKKGGPEPVLKNVGEGLVDRVDSWKKFKDEARTYNAQDINDTIVVFETGGLAHYAEEIKELHIPYLGSGKFCERLEGEREFGFTLARQNGIDMPEYQVFHSLTETVQHLLKNGMKINGKKCKKIFFKTDAYISSDATSSAESAEDLIRYIRHIRSHTPDKRINILQEGKDGVAVSTARWWDGKNWVGPYKGTIERKKFMNGDIGPSTGCSITAEWFYKEAFPDAAKALNWEGLTAPFRQYEAPPGLYDINAILADGKAWFLEWTPRFGWDSEGVSLPLLYQNLSAWFGYIAAGRTSNELNLSPYIAYGVRLTVPPYPWEHGTTDQNGSSEGIGVWGEPLKNLYGKNGFIAYHLKRSKFPNEYMVASPEGYIGLTCASGDSLSELHEQVMETTKKIRTSVSPMYRSDGDEAICADAERASDEGFTLHPGLTR